MTDTFSFDGLLKQLERNKIEAEPSEVHGLLTGMLCGGVKINSEEWLGAMSDMINDGQAFSKEGNSLLFSVFHTSLQSLQDKELTFEPILPRDDETISERIEHLILWVQSFLVGFGLNMTDLSTVSDDVREVVEDFAELTRLDTELEPSTESEDAYHEVVEYIRISTLLCFSELGQRVISPQTNPRVLH
ncbi:UPF0149 family protein [Algicola sagamiensis]|uniref:UPF0149 family protein n=1 Tax=Algicola sagamiensis TaxID=163869 RepID=UPI000375571D|nr:UPF0149 family protein [Algicola sagamiensis]